MSTAATPAGRSGELNSEPKKDFGTVNKNGLASKRGNRTLSRVVLLVGIALIIYIVGVLAYDWSQIKRATPPDTVTNFEQFLSWRPDVREFRIISFGGAEHLDAIGPVTISFASGRSSYVFDATGKMTHWTYDIGDDSKFQHELNIYQQADLIDLDAATCWLRNENPAAASK